MRLGVIDALLILLERSGVGRLLGDDLRQAVALLDLHPGRRGERVPGDHRPELDELAGGNVQCPQQHLRAEELNVAPDVDGVAPRLEHRPGRDLGRSQPVERHLPLGAPDLEVDVDDVVVGHGNAPQPVVHGERAELVGGPVVPDDAERVAHLGRSVRVGGVDAAELGAPSRPVRPAALGHADAIDRLAVAERDVAKTAAERPAERVGDVLVDEQAAVLRDLHRDRRLREAERLRAGRPRDRKCGERRCEEEAARSSEARAHRRREELPGRPELPGLPERRARS